ncbi:MAG: thiamine-binding protein [Pseudomonadota bacterium]
MAVMEIALEPVGSDDPHLHELVARSIRPVEESGLPYSIGPMSTTIQGSLDRLLEIAGQMVAAARDSEGVPRVFATIRIDESKEAEHSLRDRVRLVEQELAI